MKAVSLFSGVGAFELALQRKGIKTILSCEIDKHACEVLKYRFPDTEVWNGDVRLLKGEYIRGKYGEIDIITAGFPCQSFSIAGQRQGFQDITRGTLFFEVIRLADELGKPAYIFLENVKGLLTHEEGRTFGVILESLGELGYDAEWQVLNSKDFGVPQNRERVFIVGHSRERSTQQIFPVRASSRKNEKMEEPTKSTRQYNRDLVGCLTARGAGEYHSGMQIIKATKFHTKNGFQRKKDFCYSITTKSDYTNSNIISVGQVSNDGSQSGKVYSSKENFPTVMACTHGYAMGNIQINSDLRRITPIECERLQGFPDGWTAVNGMSDTQRYKQMGNSITVNVLDEIFKCVKST